MVQDARRRETGNGRERAASIHRALHQPALTINAQEGGGGSGRKVGWSPGTVSLQLHTFKSSKLESLKRAGVSDGVLLVGLWQAEVVEHGV